MTDGVQAVPIPIGTAPETLKQWCAAELSVAVARRSRLAAEAAASAAANAAVASQVTAEASRRALESAILAEGSAAETAKAARLAVLANADQFLWRDNRRRSRPAGVAVR